MHISFAGLHLVCFPLVPKFIPRVHHKAVCTWVLMGSPTLFLPNNSTGSQCLPRSQHKALWACTNHGGESVLGGESKGGGTGFYTATAGHAEHCGGFKPPAGWAVMMQSPSDSNLLPSENTGKGLAILLKMQLSIAATFWVTMQDSYRSDDTWFHKMRLSISFPCSHTY